MLYHPIYTLSSIHFHIPLPCLYQGFQTLSLLTFQARKFSAGGEGSDLFIKVCLHSISGLYPLATNSSSVLTPKSVSRLCQMSSRCQEHSWLRTTGFQHSHKAHKAQRILLSPWSMHTYISFFKKKDFHDSQIH